MDDCSYLEEEHCLVFDHTGVIGRSVYVVDFEGLVDLSEVDFVFLCKVDIDAVDVCSAIDKNSCVDVFSLSGIEHVGWYSKLFRLFSYNYTVNISRGSMRLGGTTLQKSCAKTAPTVGSSSELGISSILAETSGFLVLGFFPSFLRKGFLQSAILCPGFPHP